jgi:lipopolysaccharide export LptBFGC system permease protein LptF
MVLLLWLWTLGILVMYTTSKFTRLQRGRQDVAGEYKAIFELADAMREQIVQQETEKAEDVHLITESKLRQRISKDLRGGAIAYDSALLPGTDGTRAKEWSFGAWAKREMWWLFALAVSLVVEGCLINTFVRYGLRGDVWVFVALPLTIAFAMYVGASHRSRGMVLFWAVLVVCVLPAIILGVMIGIMMQR